MCTEPTDGQVMVVVALAFWSKRQLACGFKVVSELQLHQSRIWTQSMSVQARQDLAVSASLSTSETTPTAKTATTTSTALYLSTHFMHTQPLLDLTSCKQRCQFSVKHDCVRGTQSLKKADIFFMVPKSKCKERCKSYEILHADESGLSAMHGHDSDLYLHSQANHS